MHIYAKTFALTLGLTPLAAGCIPEPIPVTNGCASFPGFIDSTQPTSPWLISAVNNTSPINGHGLTFVNPESTVGRVVIPIDNMFAKMAVRCNPTNGSVPFFEGFDGTWHTLGTASALSTSAKQIFWGVSGAAPIRAYTFDAGSGLPGLYFGGEDRNVVWGVKDEDSTYWRVRLLGLESLFPWHTAGLAGGEVKSFLKVLG